jgi:fluoride exporter
MYRLFALTLAGALGTLARYWLSGWVARRYGEAFPAGTLVVNLVGCFAIGFIYHLSEERALLDPILRTALMLGLLGAFTTFSSFGMQTVNLLRDGEFLWAALYVTVSNLAGIFLAWAGLTCSKLLEVRTW